MTTKIKGSGDASPGGKSAVGEGGCLVSDKENEEDEEEGADGLSHEITYEVLGILNDRKST